MMSLAYRAILAEPRTKATSSEDYSGGSNRGEYMGGNDTMNQYAAPMGKDTFFASLISAFSETLETLAPLVV